MLLAVMVSAAFADQFTGNYADAKAHAAKVGKPLLVDFFTDW